MLSKIEFMRLWLVVLNLFFWHLMLSCSTTPKYTPAPHVPTSFSTKFSDCKHGDGNLKVQAKRLDAESSFSFELDWVRTSNTFEFQSVDPMGRSLLEFKYNYKDTQNPWVLRGSENISSKFEIAGNGEIRFDGNYLGFLIHEAPCFLNGKLPLEWLDQLSVNPQEISLKDSARFYSFRDQREIQLVGSGLSDAKLNVLCADVSWKEYLGLISRRIKFCFHYKAQEIDIRINDDENFEVLAHTSEGE